MSILFALLAMEKLAGKGEPKRTGGGTSYLGDYSVYGTEGQRQWTPTRHVAETVTRTGFTTGLTYGGGSFGGVITTTGEAAIVKPGPGGTAPDPSGGEQSATDPGSQKRKERGGFFRV